MKHRLLFSYGVTAATALCMVLGAAGARADTVTNINISSQYGGGGVISSGDWNDALGGPSIAAAPTDGNQNTGVTFANWTGNFSEIDAGDSRIFTVPSIALTANSRVNTLLNLFYGDGSLDSIVTFTNSNAATVTYNLYGNQTIRDYNNASYANDLQGFNTLPGQGAVTTKNWWNNGSGQRLDVQSFLLPSGWSGTTLESIEISTPNYAYADSVFSAAQVVNVSPSISGTPEPSSLVLLGTGLLGAVGAARRKLTR